MKDIKKQLIAAADYLDELYEGAKHIPENLRHSPKVKGRVEDYDQNTAALCFYGGMAESIVTLGPAMQPLLAQWLRTESLHLVDDELHGEECTIDVCTAVAAAAVAERILKARKINYGRA